jgi:hypothetical protein
MTILLISQTNHKYANEALPKVYERKEVYPHELLFLKLISTKVYLNH